MSDKPSTSQGTAGKKGRLVSAKTALLDKLSKMQHARNQRAEHATGQRPAERPTPKPEAVQAATTAKGLAAEVADVNETLPGRRSPRPVTPSADDELLDMIARVQGSRIEDQRTELPRPTTGPQAIRPAAIRTVPPDADDLFSAILRAQVGRMDDQRTPMPPKDKTDKTKK